ncbi:MAG TPA: PQQ-dependent sugar dehydrogenase [Candidatus Limnocylindrales bacterium]|nr:PQQ-dependent sugar dehydrogenase [Candidatus Limnocylindrales bacterium]
MARHPRLHALRGTLLAALVAACSGNAPQPPATSSAPIAPATSPPTLAATATPSAAATAAATGSAIDGLSITSAPFAKISGSALSMAAPDDGTGRLFVGGQDGRIWVVNRDGSVEQQPLVDLSARIRSGGEQGLLGLAVHPAFPMDPRVFVDFTDTSGDTVIASLTIDPGNKNRIDPGSFRQVLFIDQPFPNHNGGSLAFGRDGYLTIAMGDGGSGGDPMGNGQNPNALLAKILRIDMDGGTGDKAYGIPAENPYAKGGGAPEVWISGMRNPWRTSFDRKTGDFWIGDVGQNAFEEVDVVRHGTAGAINFGWNVTEGFHCYEAATCDQAGLTAPVAEFGHDLGCAVVGGYVYRGATYPFLDGTYLFSDNCSSRVWALDARPDGPTDAPQVGEISGNVASFGQDAAGELYLLMLDGSILKVVATRA